jgi:glycosyltransferase involved in cell wall biosynthesis
VIIRSFSAGGAERQLIGLLRHMDKARFAIKVLCFYPGPWQGQASSIAGIQVEVLGKSNRYDFVGFGLRLAKVARAFRPDIVYGYMFTADLLALLIARLTGARAVWGLRSSKLDYGHYDYFTRAVHWLSRSLAGRAHLLIANSHAGLHDYLVDGGRPRWAVVIPNGVDVDRFRPDSDARIAVRRAWGRSAGDMIIGLVGRIDPMKGHDVFLHAAAELLRQRTDVWFACVGSATTQNSGYAVAMHKLAERLGIAAHVMWVGQVDAIETVYPALDLLTSASRFGEGLSNSVAEAMACGVPCVVTNVGDNASVIGGHGEIVPAGDWRSLCAAWRRQLARPPRPLAAAAREHIIEQFSVRSCVAQTQDALLASLEAP